MKFLLDVFVSSRSLQAFLIHEKHEVTSAATINIKASDEQLMAFAFRENMVLLT
ncbi:MAG: DUF5615 family PIN-like protein [Candidatus Schekmanbacteria bacterium]|nr:DUF5615 family PIN-like protein [Candidatus Schekmanbacteria bacterium]